MVQPLQLEATEAAMEVTKDLKPSCASPHSITACTRGSRAWRAVNTQEPIRRQQIDIIARSAALWLQSRQRIRLPILHSPMWCRVHLGYLLILESSSRSQ